MVTQLVKAHKIDQTKAKMGMGWISNESLSRQDILDEIQYQAQRYKLGPVSVPSAPYAP
jgi:hypothetical protein